MELIQKGTIPTERTCPYNPFAHDQMGYPHTQAAQFNHPMSRLIIEGRYCQQSPLSLNYPCGLRKAPILNSDFVNYFAEF